MTKPTMLGMFAGADLLGILFLILLLCAWIWTLVECKKREQFFWMVAVLLMPILGVIAHLWLGRGARPVVDKPPQPLPPTRSFPNKAANFSLFAPLVAPFVISLAAMLIYMSPLSLGHGNRPAVPMVIIFFLFGSVPLLSIPAGLVLGVGALVGADRLKSGRIFWKAFVGICLNGLLCLFLFLSLLADMRRVNSTHGRSENGGDAVAEPGGAVNGSQPILSETNRTPSAARSRR
jgi:hypothetical protein